MSRRNLTSSHAAPSPSHFGLFSSCSTRHVETTFGSSSAASAARARCADASMSGTMTSSGCRPSAGDSNSSYIEFAAGVLVRSRSPSPTNASLKDTSSRAPIANLT
eukprot:793140-Prymnesium_polylepis.1